MSLYISLRRNTNPHYRMEHSERSNVQMVTFEKNYKRYQYWFLIHSVQSYILVPFDKASHREIPLIFNTNVFETVNETIQQVKHDLNFMNLFCFGKEAILPVNKLEDMIQKTHLSGADVVDYTTSVNNEHDELFSLMTVIMLFNMTTGEIETIKKFNQFDKKKSSHIPIIATTNWTSFKRKFMTLHAAKKIEKEVGQLVFQDTTIVQMINL